MRRRGGFCTCKVGQPERKVWDQKLGSLQHNDGSRAVGMPEHHSPKGSDLEEKGKEKTNKKNNTKRRRSMFVNQPAERVFRGWKRWAMCRGTEQREMSHKTPLSLAGSTTIAA